MFTFTRMRAVFLALAQIWAIVMGTLASGLNAKIAAESPHQLPWPTLALVHAGFILLWIPLGWLCGAVLIRLRPEVPESAKDFTYHVGWWLLVGLTAFVLYAVLRPWLGVIIDTLPPAEDS